MCAFSLQGVRIPQKTFVRNSVYLEPQKLILTSRQINLVVRFKTRAHKGVALCTVESRIGYEIKEVFHAPMKLQ